jgi:EmrB/QacA subfamily drug resistance transporter
VQPLTHAQRNTVLLAALLALFLGAMDALVVSAAMPSVVADLGGLSLYSWVYSAYFLARAVSLPVFGKITDMYSSRGIFLSAIAIFLVASAAAGAAWNMESLIVARVFQGIGAGGIFALVYVVLADISAPSSRGRTMSLASSVWGIASVLGPTLGGVIVTWFSWRWIFLLNIPAGALCLWGIGTYFVETRSKKTGVQLDLLGVFTLTIAILSLLFAFMLGGRAYDWRSVPVLGLLVVFGVSSAAFVWVERKAADPILPLAFFRMRAFSAGNGAVFFSSVAIFSLFAYAPLFIQGVQGQTPLAVGMAMLSLSLGWSLGSLALGRFIDRVGLKSTSIAGAVILLAGCTMTLGFSSDTTMPYSFSSFFVVGVGMGFVALSTLLIVQTSLEPSDLGVATASNQFARTLGGAVGVGICGSFVAAQFSTIEAAVYARGIVDRLSGDLAGDGAGQIERLLLPEVRAAMPASLNQMVQDAVSAGVAQVFFAVVVAAVFCLLLCLALPGSAPRKHR